MTTLVRSLSKAKTFSPEFLQINWRKLYYVVFYLSAILLFLFLVFYVFQINELTKGNYVTKNYDKEVKTLSDKNATLETIFAEVDFLGDVQKKAGEMNFEKVKAIKYIQVLDSFLAKR